MGGLAAGLLLVLFADQVLKRALRRRLGPRSVPLGAAGHLRMVKARIWLARTGGRPNPTAMWTLWLLAAGAMALFSALAPSWGWFAGLLLGGSLSHGLETSLDGGVSDYVCLRFWPAFNLADVAIAVGAVGVALGTIMAMKDLWS